MKWNYEKNVAKISTTDFTASEFSLSTDAG